MTVAKSNGTPIGTTASIFVDDEKKIQNNALLLNKQEDNDHDDEITLEDLAPDGGWGWMVAFAMILIFVSIHLFLHFFLHQTEI